MKNFIFSLNKVYFKFLSSVNCLDIEENNEYQDQVYLIFNITIISNSNKN